MYKRQDSLSGDAVAERLRALQVDTMTPIEALNALYEPVSYTHLQAVLKNSGYEEISLSSLSTSDYGELSGLTECMPVSYTHLLHDPLIF